jgi:hypothetical protein
MFELKIEIEIQNPDFFSVLHSGLSENFEEVSVKVVQSPDLTQEPFNLAASGKKLF